MPRPLSYAVAMSPYQIIAENDHYDDGNSEHDDNDNSDDAAAAAAGDDDDDDDNSNYSNEVIYMLVTNWSDLVFFALMVKRKEYNDLYI